MKFWLAIDQLCLDELQDVHFYQEVLKATYLIDCISEGSRTLSTWEMLVLIFVMIFDWFDFRGFQTLSTWEMFPMILVLIFVMIFDWFDFRVVSNPLNLGDVPNGPCCGGTQGVECGRGEITYLAWYLSRHVFCLNFQCDNMNIIFISQFSILGLQIAPSDLHLGLTPEGGQPVLTGLGPLRTHDRWTNKLEQLYDVFLLQPPLSLISLLRTHDRRWTAGQL